MMKKTTYEELQAVMLSMLDNNPELAKHIGSQSREFTDFTLAEDEDHSLDIKQRNNYAIFFCIGATWAISQNINNLTK